ncbi:MAG: hypothetical protein SNH79_02660 [Rikenellaceae bacterium]
MSKEFDIEKIVGRKMPYEAPNAEFFEQVSTNVMARIKNEEMQKRGSLSLSRRIVATCAAIAASVALFCGFYISNEYSASSDEVSEYFSQLSDDELMVLFYDMEFDDTFYSAL